MDEQGVIADIRPGMAEDVPAAQRVIAEGLRAYGYEIDGELEVDFADPVGFYRGRGGEFLVMAVPGAGVVGTVAVLKHDDETCVLRRMYLDERFHGHRLGRRLLIAAIEWARGAGFGTMELATAPTMTIATTLYLSEGFTFVGESQRFGHLGLSYTRRL